MDCTIQNDSLIEVPPEAQGVLDALESAGYEAWLVGGCVRDSILARPVSDFDIATDAPWEETERVLKQSGYDIHRTGTKHGTVTAVRKTMALEVTTYRTDGVYSDGRHPDSVEFVSTIQEDLARRDFTMNALAYHPKRGLQDPFGGLQDIQQRIIRAVGDPSARFTEDSLRILRACRFASELDFTIDPITFQAMMACKMGLVSVSEERIVYEMDRLLLGTGVQRALMECVDVLGAILPEIVACKGFDQHTPYHIYDVWEHTTWVVAEAPRTRLGRWSALLHDIGKPGAFFMEGDRGHFYGHGKLSVVLAGDILRRLRFSPRFSERVLTLVRIHDRQLAPSRKSVRRLLAQLNGDKELFETLLGLKRADALGQSPLSAPRLDLLEEAQRIYEELQAEGAPFSISDLAIDGFDVMALGVESGPEVGAILRSAFDAVTDEEIANERDILLEFIQKRI